MSLVGRGFWYVQSARQPSLVMREFYGGELQSEEDIGGIVRLAVALL